MELEVHLHSSSRRERPAETANERTHERTRERRDTSPTMHTERDGLLGAAVEGILEWWDGRDRVYGDE
jgi:hypothetical protein